MMERLQHVRADQPRHEKSHSGGWHPHNIVAQQALFGPVLIALCLTAGIVVLGPWEARHRLILAACVLLGGVLAGAEYRVPWAALPPWAYLPMPVIGLLTIGLGMSASGGWSSPFAPFLMLPAVYAVTTLRAGLILPVATVAGLVSASPGLYTPHTSFLLAALGAVPAYCTLVLVVAAIMTHLRRTDGIVEAERDARQQSDARARDLLTLQRTSAIVSSHLGMEEALEAIVGELSRAFGHSLISVYVLQGADLVMQVQLGYDFYFERISPGQGVIGASYERGETVFVRDAGNESSFLEAAGGVQSEIAVPLRDDHGVIGVLNIESREELTEHDRDLMELFGAQVSVVLRNARLTAELRVRAERDPLTGLLNRRALMSVLDASLDAESQLCAVLVVDLNNFKAVNDSYGHLAGDTLLRHVSGILSRACRETDACGRYGGDEFVLILPGTNRKQAELVVSRLERVMGSEPCMLSDDLAICPTVAVGVAVAPENGATREALLSFADAEMYRAKAGYIA